MAEPDAGLDDISLTDKAPDSRATHRGAGIATPVSEAPSATRRTTFANIGRTRHSSTKTGDLHHTTRNGVDPRPCRVCGRPACPLVSHRLYVFPRRQDRDTSRGSIQNSSTTRPPLLEALHPSQILDIRTGRFDPFVGLPIKERTGDNELFQYFFKISAGRIVTATGPNATKNLLTAKLLPFALQHPAMCQGAIVYAAAQLANIRGETVPDHQSLAIYNKSLHLLTKAVRDDPGRSKDVFIVAAIAVAGFDLTHGRVQELRRHLDGLHKIVQSIGGLHYLGMGGLAAHLVLWMDFFGSIMLNRKPLYDLPSRPNITLPGPPQRYGKSFDDVHLLEATSMRTDLLAACIQTCRMTELLEKITNDSGRTGELEYFTYKRNWTDHQFALANGELFGIGTREPCICLTAITLELWILHNVGSTHAVFHHLGVELQKALMSTNLTMFWDSDIEILQWILFGAGAVMLERNGSRWYQHMARQTLINQYGDQWPSNWKDVQSENLRRFIWSDTFLSQPFEAFCNKILAVAAIEAK